MLNDVYNSIQALRKPIRQNICCFENVCLEKKGCVWKTEHMELISIFGEVQAAHSKRSFKTLEGTVLPLGSEVLPTFLSYSGARKCYKRTFGHGVYVPRSQTEQGVQTWSIPLADNSCCFFQRCLDGSWC